MATKPDFSLLSYERGHICWGAGNDVFALRLIARIKLTDKTTKKQDREEKKDYEDAKRIYDKFINKGIRFASGGKHKTTVQAKITFVNYETESVCWKQDNLTNKEIKKGYVAAKGKFSINAFITLYRIKEIVIID